MLFPERFPMWIVSAALGLLLLPWIARLVRVGRLIPATPLNIFILPILLVFLPLSLWTSPLFWEASWPKAVSLLWSAALFFAVVDAIPPGLTAVERVRRLRLLVTIYVAAGILMTAVGLLAMDSVASRLPVASGIPQIIGQGINPNEVGGVITLYLPLVVCGWAATWAVSGQRSLFRFIFWSLLTLFFAGVLLLTASLGAMIGVAVGCGLVFLLLNRRTRFMLVPITALALVSAIIVRTSPLFDRLALAVRMKWNSSIITREMIWTQALHSTQDFPLLGTGLGSFRYVAPALYPLGDPMQDVGHAHNLFWQATLDFGWLGGLLFALMWVVIVVYLLRAMRDAGLTEAEAMIRVLTIGLFSSLVAHAVYGLFDAIAPGARPGFTLWYLFGLSVAVGVTAAPGYQTSRRFRIATAGVILLLFASLAWFYLPVQRASSDTAAAMLEESQPIADAVLRVKPLAVESCRTNWHLGLLEHEQQALAARDSAWEQLLGCSTQHTTLMRSVAPENRSLAEAAVAKQPKNAESYFWLASLEAGDDKDGAIAYYESGLALAPGDAVRWVELGGVRQAIGDVDGAIAAYDQGCFLFDRGGNGCPRAGKLYMEIGEYELAADRYRISIEQLPGWLPAQRGLADALLAMGRDEEAVPILTVLAEKGDGLAQEQLQKATRGEK